MLIEAIASRKIGVGDEKIVPQMKKTFEYFQLLYPLKKTVTVASIISHLYGTRGRPKIPLFALLRNIANPNTVSTTISPEVLRVALLEYGLK